MSNESQSKHILAINQSQEVLDLFKALLEEDEGYRVSTQSFVEKDLTAVEKMAPDLIIIDYMWEFEDLGWTFLQMVKMSPATEAIPIVLCTGAIERVEALSGHLQRMGVRVVIKPFNLVDLLDAIERSLGNFRTGTKVRGVETGRAEPGTS